MIFRCLQLHPYNVRYLNITISVIFYNNKSVTVENVAHVLVIIQIEKNLNVYILNLKH